MIFQLTKQNHQFFYDLSTDMGVHPNLLKAHYITCCLLKIPCVFGEPLSWNRLKIRPVWIEGGGFATGGAIEEDLAVYMSHEKGVMYRIHGYMDRENLALHGPEGLKDDDFFPISDLLDQIGITKYPVKVEKTGKPAPESST